MAENDLDSGSTGGTSSSPNGDGSASKSASGGSFDASKLQSTLETVLKRVEEIDKAYKTFQSGKDRGANESKKASEEVAELKRKIAEIEKLKKAGLDEDGAIEEHSFREDIRAVKEQLSKIGSVQTQPAGNRESLVDEKAKVLAELELSANDPEVIPLLDLPEKELAIQAGKLALRKAKQSPPDSSEAGSLQGGQPAPAGVKQLTQNYIQEMKGAMGKGNQFGNAIKDKYRKLGVPVDEVSFRV